MPRQKSRLEFAAGASASGGAEGDLFATADARPDEPRKILNEWFSDIYKELHRLAAAVRRNDINATIGTSTLIHEAWIKLSQSMGDHPQSKLHFRRTAAQAMRQIVIDNARRRKASKHGGGAIVFVPLIDAIAGPVMSNDDLLTLNDALDSLARISPRQAELVELRFFGGNDIGEAAAILGISEATAVREWRPAKAFLAAEIRKAS